MRRKLECVHRYKSKRHDRSAIASPSLMQTHLINAEVPYYLRDHSLTRFAQRIFIALISQYSLFGAILYFSIVIDYYYIYACNDVLINDSVD